MDNLPKLAIVLLYPDGSLETIPITHFKNHIDYLKEHLKKSPRFAKLCQGLEFGFGVHYHIDKTLTEQGVIVFYNFNARDIVEDPTILNDDVPYFQIYMFEEFGSSRQLNEFLNVFENYPKEHLIYFRYYSKKKDFDTNTYIQVKEHVEASKYLLESEEHKL